MRLAQSRLGADPPATRSTARPRGPFDPSTPAGVLRLQRTAGNRATSALIARLPYQTAHGESQVRRILNDTEQQDKAVKDALASAQGQAQLALLDAAPAGQKTVPGEIKDWELRSGSATKASVIVESTGSGRPGDIHIQTAYPLVG